MLIIKLKNIAILDSSPYCPCQFLFRQIQTLKWKRVQSKILFVLQAFCSQHHLWSPCGGKPPKAARPGPFLWWVGVMPSEAWCGAQVKERWMMAEFLWVHRILYPDFTCLSRGLTGRVVVASPACSVKQPWHCRSLPENSSLGWLPQVWALVICHFPWRMLSKCSVLNECLFKCRCHLIDFLDRTSSIWS